MAINLITKAAYARHRGCDEKAVRKAITDGRISTIDGKIDPAVADIQWVQNTRARADSGPKAGDLATGVGAGAAKALSAPVATETASGDQYAGNRARREKYDADKAQMEAEKMAGGLIQRATTERAIFDSFRALRDAIMASPQRAAPKVIGMAEARDIEHTFTEELKQAFEGWEARMLDRLKTQGAA